MAFGFTYTLPTLGGSHTNFPLLLKTSDFPTSATDGGASSVDNGGGNLRAYTSSAKTTQLPLEVVTFVTGGTPDIEVHVKLPTAATGTTLFLEADDVATSQPAVTGTYGRNAVWSDYSLVVHGGTVVDSTGNESDGTLGGGLSTIVTGPHGWGSAYDFDNNDDAITFVNLISTQRALVTLKLDADPIGNFCVIGDSNASNVGLLVVADESDFSTGYTKTFVVTFNTTRNRKDSGTDYAIGGSSYTIQIERGGEWFLDGTDVETFGTEVGSSSTAFVIGGSPAYTTAPIDGSIGEVRLTTATGFANSWNTDEEDMLARSTAWGAVGSWESAGGDTAVNATTDALTLTEQNATIAVDIEILANTAALTLSEQPAAVALNVEVTAITDALALAEQAAAITIDIGVNATTDALTLAEQAATISFDVGIAATTDALVLTENAATVSLDVNVAATTDALTLLEQAATVEAGLDVNVSATTDALTLAEFAATIEASTNVQANTDALTLTEFAATVDAEINVQANTDSLTLTESAASVTLDVEVAATTAALTLTERAAAIEASVNVQAITDNLVLTELSATVSLDVEVVGTTAALTLVENAATVDVGDINILAATAELSIVEFQATVTGVNIAGDSDISFSTQFDDSVNVVGAFDDSVDLEGSFDEVINLAGNF